jgi:hypothetical protein
VWDDPTVDRLLAGWGETPDADRLAARSAWRDRRLAALKAHKAAQPEDSTVS